MVYYEESQSISSDNNDWFLAATEENSLEQQDDEAESDYSLDYEYLGPRKPNYRSEQDPDSDASELSCSSPDHEGFDMWDEDPYSTNDFTWESNDMRLTGFIKERQKELNKLNKIAPWKNSTFWRKEKGWPKQLPCSSSTTNHDQSASALSLVLSDYGLSEKLHAVYRDRIVECGKFNNNSNTDIKVTANTDNVTTWLETNDYHGNNFSSSSIKFNETHASVSLPKQPTTMQQQKQQQQQQLCSLESSTNNADDNFVSKFIPYTKYIKRSQFPVVFPQDAYLALDFEPLCLAEKYGYMAIGGVEGEFELYCCMDENKPVKIWGTKFKGKDNVLLMTNSVQIVRWKKSDSDQQEDYSYFLLACMNDAGILIYDLPSHRNCNTIISTCHLNYHIRCFDHVPINDARVSPNGQHLVCVGDDACIFHLSVSFNQQKNRLIFGTPQKLKIPTSIPTFSSQYLTWSKSSLFFAHTSDTHNAVFIWKTQPKFEMLHKIDAGGYTYAIQFHPEQEGVLAFSNRYGYIHTINLDEAIFRNDPNKYVSITDYYQNTNIVTRHEITMISFRGEKNRKLRILAKINGLQWSKEGSYLYVSTKKRVLAYEFIQSSRHVQSLEKMAGKKALSILEDQKNKRKKDKESPEKRKKRKLWSEKWDKVPAHVRYNVLGNTHFASHW
ncbi:hypothetical protein BDF21DRAFT_407507 [Thamnidium elegans]|nr:hypothetical protein BDF21DRAFT_407507 [Thamnidium elegans]